MTFSEVYLTLCIELERILREWWRKRGPQIGDWCTPKDPAEPGHGLAFLIGSKSRRFYRLYSSEGTQRWSLLAEHLIEDFIPLPSQRQLEQMLEERGWAWRLGTDPYKEHDAGERRKSYEVNAARLDAILADWKSTDDRDFVEDIEGPDPETTLLRCVLEVVKGG